MVIVWSAVLCATIVHSAMHTHMDRPNSCFLVRFSFSVVILHLLRFILLDLGFWDYFVLGLYFVCACVLLLH